MTRRDQEEMLRDGSSDTRRANFAAGAAKSRAWERDHPLEDYLEFLRAMQELLGPFPVDHAAWAGEDFRL